MSKIEWTDTTWNPTIGCREVSPGCTNCYAARMAWRLAHIPAMQKDYAGLTKKLENGKIVWTGEVKEMPERLMEPLIIKKPTKFFVDSMSDLFHEDVSFEFINAVFSVMSDADQHTYQILTKRPERMLEFFRWKYEQFKIEWTPKKNVWLGVSVENQKEADERIPILAHIPCDVKFLSCEPLLEKIIFKPVVFKMLLGNMNSPALENIQWVIAGGESGPGARPVHPEWLRYLRDQCAAEYVPFFFKQWGNWQAIDMPHSQETVKPLAKNERWLNLAGGWGFHGEQVYRMRNVGKAKTGRLLDGEMHNAFPTE